MTAAVGYREEIGESIRSMQLDMEVMRDAVLETIGMMDNELDRLNLLSDMDDPDRVGEVMQKMTGVIAAVNLAQSLDPSVDKSVSWLSGVLDLRSDIPYVGSAQKFLFKKLIAADRIDDDIPEPVLRQRYTEVRLMMGYLH